MNTILAFENAQKIDWSQVAYLHVTMLRPDMQWLPVVTHANHKCYIVRKDHALDRAARFFRCGAIRVVLSDRKEDWWEWHATEDPRDHTIAMLEAEVIRLQDEIRESHRLVDVITGCEQP